MRRLGARWENGLGRRSRARREWWTKHWDGLVQCAMLVHDRADEMDHINEHTYCDVLPQDLTKSANAT